MPSTNHEPYRALPPKDRVAVSKLAGLLRLADALDTSHTGNVKSVRAHYRKPNLVLHLGGEGDLLLERWGVLKKAALFEQVFGVKVVVDEA
jgi:exopolyphosphatase/guanosine-5'-triphosphate,3'-diphosphate pyrophosphatase